MLPIGEDAPSEVKLLVPWLALGHGVFNTFVMLLFFYQGWLGHVIRREHMAGAPAPLAAVRRHRKAGPLLATLCAAGFLAGVIIVVIDKGRVVEYPLHFITGLGIVLSLGASYLISREIKGRDSPYRGPHRVLGMIVLYLFAVQTLLGLSILL